jgi:hypothetical protein
MLMTITVWIVVAPLAVVPGHHRIGRRWQREYRD